LKKTKTKKIKKASVIKKRTEKKKDINIHSKRRMRLSKWFKSKEREV